MNFNLNNLKDLWMDKGWHWKKNFLFTNYILLSVSWSHKIPQKYADVATWKKVKVVQIFLNLSCPSHQGTLIMVPRLPAAAGYNFVFVLLLCLDHTGLIVGITIAVIAAVAFVATMVFWKKTRPTPHKFKPFVRSDGQSSSEWMILCFSTNLVFFSHLF